MRPRRVSGPPALSLHLCLAGRVPNGTPRRAPAAAASATPRPGWRRRAGRGSPREAARPKTPPSSRARGVRAQRASGLASQPRARRGSPTAGAPGRHLPGTIGRGHHSRAPRGAARPWSNSGCAGPLLAGRCPLQTVRARSPTRTPALPCTGRRCNPRPAPAGSRRCPARRRRGGRSARGAGRRRPRRSRRPRARARGCGGRPAGPRPCQRTPPSWGSARAWQCAGRAAPCGAQACTQEHRGGPQRTGPTPQAPASPWRRASRAARPPGPAARCPRRPAAPRHPPAQCRCRLARSRPARRSPASCRGPARARRGPGPGSRSRGGPRCARAAPSPGGRRCRR
mmetsp:Transcript_28467/g.90716  ORF Transcript_28467/g.90716 Transcript_28467/m.90716 type:complete len:341 (+) Transcript_28467:17-1039(+)